MELAPNIQQYVLLRRVIQRCLYIERKLESNPKEGRIGNMFPRVCFIIFCLTSVILTSCQKSDSPVDVALAQTMTTMHLAMHDVLFVGKPDADFALMMIPHHQGAVDMAKVELQFGTDPRLRRLAQEIIVTQQSEIQVMTGVLKDYNLSILNQKRKNWCSR
jgi:hypothetical protein